MIKLVLSYHIVLSAYGFWLPNDPRGSWSDFVWSRPLAQHGDATKTNARRSIANKMHNNEQRHTAKQSLKHHPVLFEGIQARAIARGFAKAKSINDLTIFACAILTDHVHMVVKRHVQLWIEDMAARLKANATRLLTEENLHPFAAENRDRRGRLPTPWAESFWQVYLNSDEDIRRSITYVERNPLKDGLKSQRWSFVCPYVPA